MDIKLETLHLKKSVRCQLFVFMLTYCTDIYIFRIDRLCNKLNGTYLPNPFKKISKIAGLLKM